MSLFFDDDKLTLRKKAALRAPPPIPNTGWLPPREFPNLSLATAISVDTETFDPNLLEMGPGWGRGDGHIVGISLAAVDNLGNRGKWYFPMRHEVERQYNLDPQHVLRFANDVLSTPLIPKIFANAIYDIGWLAEERVNVKGQLHDVQFAEALLHEAGDVNLEHLGNKYTGRGKETSVLYQWLAGAYGGDANSRQRANLYRSPPRLAGAYAEADADIPLDVLDRQWPLLVAEDLMAVYRMECDLIPMIVAMRRKGVRVDIHKAENLYAKLSVDIKSLYKKISADTGIEIDSVDSDKQMQALFDKLGVKYPRTAPSNKHPDGQPSFVKGWLEKLEHPIGKEINEIREYQKMRGTFVKSYILEGHVKGRIHCSFNPMRGDASGTRSGRFSSDNPNLQNIPVRSKLGKEIRELFIPDDGALWWKKFDYSQIEYRCLVHYAVGDGANAVRAQYNEDPATDYHVLTQRLVFEKTGMRIERKPIKNINFGLLYGMGEGKLARQLGVDKATSKDIFAGYHGGNPYVKATMDATADEAQRLGYITTIMGRRSRFDMWEPVKVNYDDRAIALPLEMALREYGTAIQRAHTHKAINRRLQGSSADMMKRAMLEGWNSGVFDYIGLPPITVHDELDFSDMGGRDDGFIFFQNLMESCMSLRVPIRADMDIGPNWGQCESLEDLQKSSPTDARIQVYTAYDARRAGLALATA